MRGFITRLFGDPNQREIKKLQPIVEKINRLDEQTKALSDEALRQKTTEFKERFRQAVAAAQQRVEEIKARLPENLTAMNVVNCRKPSSSYSRPNRLPCGNCCRKHMRWCVKPAGEARMRHFDVQLLGGIVLHQGRIAEMKTGEGKTLVATLPAYLNALAGHGVHIVTVNDYLASRDREWMGPLYEFLGLSVGLIVHGLTPQERRAAYQADITYGTNNEFGFDYLRDNMVRYQEELVQRPLSYAIIDEVDSILIDEARTPLIISGQMRGDEEQHQDYLRVDQAVRRLKAESHFTVDEKAKTVLLTEEGEYQVEALLGEKGLYGQEEISDDELASAHQEADSGEIERKNVLRKKVENALRAHHLMKRDRDYVVKDEQIIIVDEFTGRLMYGRRYSEGLHGNDKEQVKA